jgi:hypothetical protein
MSQDRGLTRLLDGSTHVRHEEGEDEAIAQLATRQHGVVARAQLLELGISEEILEHRIKTGHLRRVFRSRWAAYAVGHEALSLQGRAVAGVIAAGPGSAASHWTKLALHDLLAKPRPLIHVTAPAPRKQRRGLFIHRATIPADELETTAGIPTLSLPRTFLDLSADLGERPLRTLIKRAEYRGIINSEEILLILERYPRRRGRKSLAGIARGYALTAGRTNSPLEDEYIEFCGERDIPLPETNVPIAAGGRTYTIDCVYRKARLAIELDGRDAHTRELAFADDRARDRALTVAGWRPVRITSEQLKLDRDQLEVDLLRMTNVA